MKLYRYEKTTIQDIFPIVREHAGSLSAAWDSYTEGNLFQNETYMICHEDNVIGYVNISKDNLYSFYITKCYYRYAPDILEDIVKIFNIRSVEILTSDSLLTGLLMEWEYKVEEKSACFFSDGERMKRPKIKASNPLFREATLSDMEKIAACTGNFFDNLKEQIEDRRIFMLEDANALMGCGIVEIGKIFVDCVSIGMVTCKEHRNKGVAQTILWHLKEWAYARNLKPIAGCWYYNVLSRKSLEASGMVATGKSYVISLIEKQILPLRTGNPPGELL